MENIPEELYDKWAKQDLELLKPILAEYPSLASIEQQISTNPPKTNKVKLEELVFNQLKCHHLILGKMVYEKSMKSGTLYVSTIFMQGVITRSLNIYRGALWALANGNPHVYSACLRAQCETLALLDWCKNNPDNIKAATMGSRNNPDKELNIPNVLTLIDKLDKTYKDIRKDYDQLCEIVHPNPTSLLASTEILDKKERVVAFTTKPVRYSDEDAQLRMRLLTYWTKWLLDEAIQLGIMLNR